MTPTRNDKQPEQLADWYHELKEVHDRKCPYCNPGVVQPDQTGITGDVYNEPREIVSSEFVPANQPLPAPQTSEAEDSKSPNMEVSDEPR